MYSLITSSMLKSLQAGLFEQNFYANEQMSLAFLAKLNSHHFGARLHYHYTTVGYALIAQLSGQKISKTGSVATIKSRINCFLMTFPPHVRRQPHTTDKLSNLALKPIRSIFGPYSEPREVG